MQSGKQGAQVGAMKLVELQVPDRKVLTGQDEMQGAHTVFWNCEQAWLKYEPLSQVLQVEHVMS